MWIHEQRSKWHNAGLKLKISLWVLPGLKTETNIVAVINVFCGLLKKDTDIESKEKHIQNQVNWLKIPIIAVFFSGIGAHINLVPETIRASLIVQLLDYINYDNTDYAKAIRKVFAK